MSFYGNLVNTNRTTFYFDKIYPNRTDMDTQSNTDNIMIGRFVLVRYGEELSRDAYIKDFFVEKQFDTNKLIVFLPDENGVKSNTFITKEDLTTGNFKDLKVFGVEIEHYKEFITEDTYYIEYDTNTNNWIFIQWDNYKMKVHYDGTEESYLDSNIPKNFAEVKNESLQFDYASAIGQTGDEPPEFIPEKLYLVVKNDNYFTVNEQEYYFKINKMKTFKYKNVDCYEIELIMDEENFYALNLQRDKENYPVKKGYDSTVWQKVVEDGREKYIKVAELNTVVPNFNLSVDAPQLIQTPPHLGQKSTNIDYDLHWSNNWGFRIKAANQNLKVPTILQNGSLQLVQNSIESQIPQWKTRVIDTIQYPSDQKIAWTHNFKNIDSDISDDMILYYDIETQKWGTDTAAKLDAAIYFNKAGFDSSRIAYSDDLINESTNIYTKRYKEEIADSNWTAINSISISPTGQSGLQYNLHNGNIKQSVAPDVQEMSIMLPSIGDAIAKFWDTMYGGRDTNEDIKRSNRRNNIIEWENAKEEPARRGLRLTGVYGKDYNLKAMETVAGAINTTNDLLGMIISTHPESEIYHTPGLGDISFDRIYYNSDKGLYLRKHKTFNYIPLEENEYYFNPQDTSTLSQEKIDTGAYYELVNGEYIVATVYDPTKTYYLRSVTTRYELVEHPEELYDFPYENYLWYRDYLGENASILKELNLSEQELELKSDYIINPEYQKDREYYEVFEHPVSLSSEYEPGIYWYIDESGNILLDLEEERTIGRIYYTFEYQDLLSLKTRNYAGVYVPGVYYYRSDDGTFHIDNSQLGTCNGETVQDPNYYTVKIIKTYDENGVEQILKRVVTYRVLENAAELYVPDRYFLKTTTGNPPKDVYTICSDEEYDPTLTYYVQYVDLEYIDATQQVQAEIDQDNPIPRGSLAPFQNHTYYLKIENNEGEVVEFRAQTRRDFAKEGIEVLFNRIYPLEDIEQATNPPFYALEAVIDHNTVLKKSEDFYQEFLYHYKTDNGSYILDTAPTMTKGREYYTITVRKLPDGINFFEPGEYYQQITEEQWEAIEGNEKPEGDFYKEKRYYVFEDTRGILEKGTEWNWEAAAIPPAITLATREDAFEMIPLIGYSTKMNTVNGMILQLNKMLEPGDRLTRDLNTVSGSLNVLRDTIARFSTMRSGEAVIIDMYGRIHSAPLLTSQSTTGTTLKRNYGDILGDKFADATSVNEMNNQWITATVDWDAENPNITIHHNYQAVPNQDENISLSSGDSVDIPTPIIDKMGHVVGIKTYHITIN